MKRLLFLVLILLVGCGAEPPPKPVARPLTAAPQALAELPGFTRGPYKTAVAEALVLASPELANRKQVLRIWYPASAPSPRPVVIFSHGNWSDRDKYDNLLSHWASHGYAIIAPTHLDGRSMARGIFNSLRYGQLGLIDARVNDVQFLMDHLGQIEARLRAATNADISLKKDKLVVAGHSFGAFTAQQFAGAIASDDEQVSQAGDERVVGVIAISPPGPMFDVIHEKSWENMRGPVLVTTGTWDSNPQFWPDWQMHLMSFETAPAGDQFALVVEGADHYLGNLICRPERDEAPQSDALALVNSVSVAFLQSYLSKNLSEPDYLYSGRVNAVTGDFARLSVR